VRGEGLLLAARLDADIAPAVSAAALRSGLLVNAVQPDSLRLAPPLLVSNDEIDEAVELLGGALASTRSANATATGRTP
jgi:acetylornithine aminotransferase